MDALPVAEAAGIDMEDWAMALLARARAEMKVGMYILCMR